MAVFIFAAFISPYFIDTRWKKFCNSPHTLRLIHEVNGNHHHYRNHYLSHGPCGKYFSALPYSLFLFTFIEAMKFEEN